MPLKRAGEPIEHRVIRPMISIERGMCDMISLLEEAEEDGASLRVPVVAFDDVMRVYSLFYAALGRVQIQRFGTPELPADVWRIIFEFFLSRRHTAVWVHDGRGGIRSCVHIPSDQRKPREHQIPTLRIVCKKWSRIAGDLVALLRVPAYKPEPVAIAKAFPRVTLITMDRLTSNPEHHLQIEGVLSEYAALGTLVSFTDERKRSRDGESLIPFDVHGLFIDWIPDHRRERKYINPGLESPAWPCHHDRTKLYASFRIDHRPEFYAEALVRAYCVEFSMLVFPIVSDKKFRARTICFNINYDDKRTPLHAKRFEKDAICNLFQPERWENEQLPTVYIIYNSYWPLAEVRGQFNKIVSMLSPIVPHLLSNISEALAPYFPIVTHSSKFEQLVG